MYQTVGTSLTICDGASVSMCVPQCLFIFPRESLMRCFINFYSSSPTHANSNNKYYDTVTAHEALLLNIASTPASDTMNLYFFRVLAKPLTKQSDWLRVQFNASQSVP